VVCDDGFAGLANGSVPCLTNRGGGGGGRAYESTWWLSPAPPDGHLVLHTACLPLGLAESSYPIDAPTLAAARAAIVELWPWEPESEHAMLEPTTKELPAGGWFEETAARG